MRKTDCLERQDLSRTYLAHHELESVFINIIIILTISISISISISIIVMVMLMQQTWYQH